MSILRICIGAGLFASLSGICMASQGVISLRGAIVDNSAQPQYSAHAIDGSVVHARRLLESTEGGGQLSERYALVDGKGQPITSGNYVVTLTFP